MFYKQLTAGGQLVGVGTTVDSAVLPEHYVEISKSEYDSFMRIFNMTLKKSKSVFKINENWEVTYVPVQD